MVSNDPTDPTGALTWEPGTTPALPQLPELPQRIRGATLTPSYVDAGVEPTTSNLDSWTCSQCGWETHAAGPVDVDEPDPWMDEVYAHQRSHEPDPRDAERGTVGEVPVVEMWLALREVPGVFDLLARVADLPRAAVARALIAVAAAVDPEATR